MERAFARRLTEGDLTHQRSFGGAFRQSEVEINDCLKRALPMR